MAHFDVESKAAWYEILDDRPRDYDAYLFISHDLRVVRTLSDEVAVMGDGRFVERGPADRIFDAPRSDYTRALIAAAFRLEVVDGAVRQ